MLGGFRSRQVMEDALSSGALDVVGIGRPMCLDPAVPRKLLEGSIEATSSHERQLKLDPKELGFDADQATMNLIEVFGDLGFYCMQIILLGHGQPVDTSMSCFQAFLRYQQNEAETLARLENWQPVAA